MDLCTGCHDITEITLKTVFPVMVINSHISVVVCSFFEFGTDLKLCFRKWVKPISVVLCSLQLNG